jgi:urea transporter
MFTALGLGMGWYAPSFQSYARAIGGAVLCVLITKALWDPLDRMQLMPLSMPFNLSIFAVLLIAQHQNSPLNGGDAKAPPRALQPDRRLLGG